MNERNPEVHALSPGRLALRRLRRNKIALAGFVVLTILYLLAIFAGLFSPYSPTADEFRDSFYHPPTSLHFRDENGSFHFRPYVLGSNLTDRNKITYSPGTPIYIQYLADANVKPYLPEVMHSTTPILTVINADGEIIAVVNSMVETDRNSGVFQATISPDPSKVLRTRTITIRSSKGETETFPVVSKEPNVIQPAGSIRITNKSGESLNAYFPQVERYPVQFFVRGWKYNLFWIFQSDLHFFGVDAPGKIFLFGTDQAGRDIFSRVLYGARISLSIGLVGVLLTTILGMMYGGIAGYYGGSLDHWMMRFAEVLLSIPALYLILALRNIIPNRMQDLYDRIRLFGTQTFAWQQKPVAFWGLLVLLLLLLSYYNYRSNWKRSRILWSVVLLAIVFLGPVLLDVCLAVAGWIVPGSTYMTSEWTYFLIIVILSAVGWAGMSRVIRGMVLSLREQEYVLAAKAVGATDFRLLTRHILPNTMGYVIVRATLLIPAYILGEVALSFLGVGVQEPAASWGNMLSASQSLRVLQQFTWSLTPGFFLFLTVLAYNFLGDGLRDALDPKHVA